MEQVIILTLEQKQQLEGQLIQPDWYYYPIQDCNGDWIITKEEIVATTNPDFLWVKELPLIDWCGYYPAPSGSTIN